MQKEPHIRVFGTQDGVHAEVPKLVTRYQQNNHLDYLHRSPANDNETVYTAQHQLSYNNKAPTLNCHA